MRPYTDLFRSTRIFRFMMNLWPPLWGQGIRIQSISPDFREIRTRLAFRWYNRGNPGAQFGGALFTMTDPFYSIMLLKNLGEEFTVWDQAATITFLRPAREAVEAVFQITDEHLDEVRHKTAESGSCSLELPVAINTLAGARVASVSRTVHIRRTTPPNDQETVGVE